MAIFNIFSSITSNPEIYSQQKAHSKISHNSQQNPRNFKTKIHSSSPALLSDLGITNTHNFIFCAKILGLTTLLNFLCYLPEEPQKAKMQLLKVLHGHLPNNWSISSSTGTSSSNGGRRWHPWWVLSRPVIKPKYPPLSQGKSSPPLSSLDDDYIFTKDDCVDGLRW